MVLRDKSSKRKIKINAIVFFGFVMFIILFFLLHAQQKLRPLFQPTPIPTRIPTPTPLPTPTPTQTPTPTPTPTPMPATAYESYFDEYSNRYQVSKDLLKKIAFCESGVSPGVVNGPYGGMYQFTIETWKATREQMGLDPNPDLRFGAREAIETAAFKISRGGVSAWKNCSQ